MLSTKRTLLTTILLGLVPCGTLEAQEIRPPRIRAPRRAAQLERQARGFNLVGLGCVS
jgi:hypothetical protein